MADDSNLGIVRLKAPLNDDLRLFLLLAAVTVFFGLLGLKEPVCLETAKILGSSLAGAIGMYMKGKA